MADLLARTVSQGLQAFMPAAIYWVWFRRSGRVAMGTAVRRGFLCARNIERREGADLGLARRDRLFAGVQDRSRCQRSGFEPTRQIER